MDTHAYLWFAETGGLVEDEPECLDCGAELEGCRCPECDSMWVVLEVCGQPDVWRAVEKIDEALP